MNNMKCGVYFWTFSGQPASELTPESKCPSNSRVTIPDRNTGVLGELEHKIHKI